MKKEIRKIIATVNCFDKKEKLAIINHLLTEEEATLDSISKSLGLKNSTSYKYLNQMVSAGIVSYRKLPGKKGRLLFKVEDASFSINGQRIKNAFGTGDKESQLVIFDVDDTLVRRSDIPEQLSSAGKDAIKEAEVLLQEKGIAVSLPPEELFGADWIFGKYGNPIEWYVGTWLSVSGVPDGEIKSMLIKKYVREYYKRIEKTAVHCKTFDDVGLFLETFNDRAYFAAMSNSSRKAIIETFRNNGILKYFVKEGKPLIVGGDEIPKSKETVEAILRMAEISPKQSYLIGDTGGDIRAAREAGIPASHTFAITRGITPLDQIMAIKPDVKIIKKLPDFATAIMF
ncbi:HAD hydrolase-like protein [Candidatus Woesearchaeota archaeon]|nr:HAD hydrolase-like protein [Candidatus Woesearchaeota archaeon]